MRGVDFVVNCYERTYRDVLEPGFMAELVAEQSRGFQSVTVLVNNVAERVDAEQRAKVLLAAGESVTRVEFVEDHLSQTLVTTGLRLRHVRRLRHFTDCCLVAATLPGPEWLVYWDADARLNERHDWVTPTQTFMDRNPEVAVGNPNNWHHGLAEREALWIEDDVAVGYGFSDVAFLARRTELAAPIYRKIAPASWRYPLAHVESVFEQRFDAYMRRDRRLRATYLPVFITHEGDAGVNYPATGARERVRSKLMSVGAAVAAQISSAPAMQAWPGPRRRSGIEREREES